MSVSLLENKVERDYHDLCPINDSVFNDEQKDILERLGSFQSPPYLEEKLFREGKFNSREEYQETFTEFKKFVALTKLYEKKMAMTSKKVDEIWHQFILFTPQYHEFCNKYLGEYLHHLPRTSYTKLDPKGRENLINNYRATFGDLPEIWRIKSHDDCSPSGWCDACGDGGSGDCSDCSPDKL